MPAGSCAIEIVALRPKTWWVLRYLAERAGAQVSRDELLDAIWADVAVTPARRAAAEKSPSQVRGRFGIESLDVGLDALSPVSKAYADRRPFAFNGTIEKVRFDFGDGVEQTPTEKLAQHIKMD